jgi:hypothetical protein
LLEGAYLAPGSGGLRPESTIATVVGYEKTDHPFSIRADTTMQAGRDRRNRVSIELVTLTRHERSAIDIDRRPRQGVRSTSKTTTRENVLPSICTP